MAVFVRFYVLDGKKSFPSILSLFVQLPLFTPQQKLLVISYENDTKYQDSSELSNVAFFLKFKTVFNKIRPVSHSFVEKSPSRVNLR